MDEMQRRCAACGSEDLIHGVAFSGGMMFHSFGIPPFSRLLPKRYEARAFVCQACGYLGHYLDDATLGRLKKDASAQR